MASENITIETVRIHLRSGNIEDINIDGRADIFGDDEIKRYTNEKGGKIVAVEGEFTYKSKRFNFTANYARESGIDMGRISVEKIGRKTGDLKTREEAYEFLSTKFEEFFIDI